MLKAHVTVLAYHNDLLRLRLNLASVQSDLKSHKMKQAAFVDVIQVLLHSLQIPIALLTI